jgi:hypothetical protein
VGPMLVLHSMTGAMGKWALGRKGQGSGGGGGGGA